MNRSEQTPMLEIRDLRVEVEGNLIVKGLDLTVGRGEVHALMGPNGSGKSTVAKVIAGHPDYEVVGGDILFEGESIFELEPDERARRGIFMAFQYPVEVPGVTILNFLRTALNARRPDRPLSMFEFYRLLTDKMKQLDIDPSFAERYLNEGFSGGEKKRSEILQLAVLEPKLAILDETDSGLDIDAVRIVADGVNRMRSPERSFLIITHYQRILNYIVPDHVHVMVDGRIVMSGGKELALELEERGYDWVKQKVMAKAEG